MVSYKFMPQDERELLDYLIALRVFLLDPDMPNYTSVTVSQYK
jgi:hypothetical protein